MSGIPRRHATFSPYAFEKPQRSSSPLKPHSRVVDYVHEYLDVVVNNKQTAQAGG
jgi:hypothetical protein